MKKLFSFITVFSMISLLFSACLEENTAPENVDPEVESALSELENSSIPDDFDYSTKQEVTVKLWVPELLSNAVVRLNAYIPDADSLEIGRATFSTQGYYEGNISVPSYVDSLLLLSDYLGLTSRMVIPINDGVAEYDYRVLYDPSTEPEVTAYYNPTLLKSAGANSFSYMGSYNYYGVPRYLSGRDEIAQNFLDDVNATLPERSKVPEAHPEYLEDGVRSSLVLTDTADVWVTFVTEGAGWRNALGYYTYTINNIPKSINDIEKLNIIFPNVSMRGSGGGLYPGDKVYLGRFAPNTVIGWFLVADGWSYYGVNNKNGLHFSQAALNSEPSENLRQHMVMFYDQVRQKFVLGFEDVPRNWAMCDNDFNDAIFYATANPVTAVKRDKVNVLSAANDSDGDGINDELDDFPYDPDKSFNNFSPSAQSNGTLAFEDLWPSKGDYDFNDCALQYNFNLIANAQNKVTQIKADFTIKHVGASYKNGFAFEIPISPDAVESVTGSVLNMGYMNIATNGVEAAMNSAVIPVAEDVTPLVGKTISITITLNGSLSTSDLGSVPFNPFLIVNAEREREVHLPDMAPTSKGLKYLGKQDDYSNVSKNRYYKTNRNLPWALNIYDELSLSPEKVPIHKTYSDFLTWANSGGVLKKDWYKRKNQ